MVSLLTIGIGGGYGTGKSTITRKIHQKIKNSMVIEAHPPIFNIYSKKINL